MSEGEREPKQPRRKNRQRKTKKAKLTIIEEER